MSAPSKCCHAPMRVGGEGETHWYVCTACNQPTDPAPRDIHRETAARAFGVPESEVTPEMRRAAKAATHGLMYGQTSDGLEK